MLKIFWDLTVTRGRHCWRWFHEIDGGEVFRRSSRPTEHDGLTEFFVLGLLTGWPRPRSLSPQQNRTSSTPCYDLVRTCYSWEVQTKTDQFIQYWDWAIQSKLRLRVSYVHENYKLSLVHPYYKSKADMHMLQPIYAFNFFWNWVWKFTTIWWIFATKNPNFCKSTIYVVTYACLP